jgi:arylformamidase
MKIYDISQEIFSCRVYPGDPAPQKQTLRSYGAGDVYNLTAFSMCAHNGTHIDAPYHFIKDGDTVERIALGKTVGMAFVAERSGDIYADEAGSVLAEARAAGEEAAKRILIKGDAVVTASAARVFAEAGVELIGVESQTVGAEEAPMEAHVALLGAGTVILEGIRLGKVKTGVYLLCAAPLSLGGADGAPCRAVLIEL